MYSQRIGVLVALVLATVGVGLFLPAVHHLRAQGQETKDRMKKLALALHACHDARKCLPPAFDAFAEINYPASVHVHLLPFIEQHSLYASFLQPHHGITSARLADFQSPQDVTLRTGAGVQNYAANLRIFSDVGPNNYGTKPLPLASVMPGHARIPQSFVCGTANTMVFATKVSAVNHPSAIPGVYIEGGSRYDADPTSPFAAFFGENAAVKQAHPSNPNATFQLAPRGAECLAWPLMAQSFSRQGITVALGDGSVRQVTADISPDSWNYALQAYDPVISSDW